MKSVWLLQFQCDECWYDLGYFEKYEDWVNWRSALDRRVSWIDGGIFLDDEELSDKASDLFDELCDELESLADYHNQSIIGTLKDEAYIKDIPSLFTVKEEHLIQSDWKDK